MSKIIRMLACTAPIVLSACLANNLKDMREREPVLVVDSAHDATSIANCVSETWVASGMTPKSVPRANGSTVMIEVAIYGMPLIVVDADTVPGGSHVTMRLHKSIWSRQNRARVDEVRACL